MKGVRRQKFTGEEREREGAREKLQIGITSTASDQMLKSLPGEGASLL